MLTATTLGETGGDAVSMSWLRADVVVNNGYLIGSAIFISALIVLVAIQISAKKFHPFLYWSVIVASTTAGTAMADFATRSLGIGYTGGSLLLFTCLMAVLGAWYRSEGAIAVETVNTPKVEAFYWAAITFSQTLGTALGDWAADTGGLGYEGAALVFGAGLAVTAALYYWTSASRVALFWAAFILTRPLGATLGDFLDKPLDHGGLALSRAIASAVLAAGSDLSCCCRSGRAVIRVPLNNPHTIHPSSRALAFAASKARARNSLTAGEWCGDRPSFA